MPGSVPSEQAQDRPPINFHLLALDPTYPEFVPLRADRQSLSQVYERLERIDAYEPILHIGWVQAAHASNNSKPYRFEPTAIDTTAIVGTVTLYKERFLHLEIDLSLESEQPVVETGFFLSLGAKDAPEVYTLTESRRIRGLTEHYFDHPQFGIIARIQDVKSAASGREEIG